jgi:hypothetical protein
MKNILILIICLSSLFSFSQVKLGMNVSYSITPAAATNPATGVPYGSNITLTCFIKNTGTVSYAGPISIYKRIDTVGATGIVTFYDSLQVNNFMPNDSVAFTIHDSITPPFYKQDGNGNTIVVWPYVAGGQTTDSLFAGPVYVTGTAGIKELEEGYLSVFPNPASHTLMIKPKPGVLYETISIYDVQAKKVAEIKFSEEIDISHLAAGTYWINVSTRNGQRFKAKFAKTE